MTESLESIIERKIRDLLDDAKEPDCPACGRKPVSPTQLTATLRLALQYVASKATVPPNGKEPGSALRDDLEGMYGE